MVVIFVGSAFFDKPSPTKASRTLRYSDFIEAVQDKQVSRVLISPDKGTAQIVESDGNRALVNLAPDQELLQLLTDNEMSTSIIPPDNHVLKSLSWSSHMHGIRKIRPSDFWIIYFGSKFFIGLKSY